MDKFTALASTNCLNFVVGSKQFVGNDMVVMDNVLAMKDHYVFKFVQSSMFLRQSKDKIYVFKMFVDIPRSGVELVKRMQVIGDMENSKMMFNSVKHLKEWTTLTFHVYNIKCCKY